MKKAWLFNEKIILLLFTLHIHLERFGFPDFRPFSPGENFVYHSDMLDGLSDFGPARSFLTSRFPDQVRTVGSSQVEILDSSSGKWVLHTLHHYQDGRSIIPVRSSVHNSGNGFSGVAHSGGAAAIRAGLKGFFEDLFY